MALGLRLLWGELGLQTAMAVLLVAPEIFIPLRRAGAEFHASTEGQAAAARVFAVLGTANRLGTAAGPAGAAGAGDAAGERALAATGAAPESRSTAAPTHPDLTRHGSSPGADLSINAVRVEHEHRDGAALESLSLHAPPGSRVALTGPSGAGKSTALAALLGFVTPSAGTIALNGRTQDATLVDAWRRSFSWLPQRPHIFNATLAENLRLGAPGADDAALVARDHCRRPG